MDGGVESGTGSGASRDSGADVGTSSGASADSGADAGSNPPYDSAADGRAQAGQDAGLDATVSDSGAPANPAFILGADISWVQYDTSTGSSYYDDDGGKKDILSLLKAHGFNYFRLRTFFDPTQPAPGPDGGTIAPYSSEGYCDLTHTVQVGQQIKAAGAGLLVDFHYSDTWADPSKQIKPAAWASEDLTTITSSLHAYTTNAIKQLVAGGARPDIVQIGNEITPGMELSPGTAMGPTSNWKQLAQLLNAGITAVHEVDPSIKIMLHIDKCGDLATSQWFITNALSSGVAFDVFGESCYVAYQGEPSTWTTVFTTLASQFPNLKFAIAEYNTDSADATEPRKANDVVHGLPNKQGLGTFFWEPTHSGAWGAGLFTWSGSNASTVPASIDLFDKMKADYGL